MKGNKKRKESNMSNLNPVFEGIFNSHFGKKVEDAEVVEEKETWRNKEVKEHLYLTIIHQSQQLYIVLYQRVIMIFM